MIVTGVAGNKGNDKYWAAKIGKMIIESRLKETLLSITVDFSLRTEKPSKKPPNLLIESASFLSLTAP